MLSIFSKCLTLHTSLYKSQNIRHRTLDAQNPFIISKKFFFKTKNSTLFSDIPSNILFKKYIIIPVFMGQYMEQAKFKIHDIVILQVIQITPSPSPNKKKKKRNISEQKEKEEEYNANENLSSMSVEWVRKLTWKIKNKCRIKWTQFSNVMSYDSYKKIEKTDLLINTPPAYYHYYNYYHYY